jgi:hypothetical protein
MSIDGDVLEIELDMGLDDVVTLHDFVKSRLEYIESIEIVGTKDQFVSSSLFALLFSLKKSKPSLTIPLIDSSAEITEYGILHWNVS